MHSDAADVSYGGTLGTNMAHGSPGSWVAQGLWSAADCAKSITLRELRAVRLLLARSFAAYVSDRRIRRLLLHEDNQAGVYILNSMVSASPAMMAELRKLQKMLHALNVRLDARWIPSAVNRYADALSRTWDPGDVPVSQQLLASIQEHYHLDSPAIYHRPLNETRPARLKQIRDQLQTYCGDGKARLWNPPFDVLQITVRKIETESARGVPIAPFWPAQAWFARLRGLASAMHLLDGNLDHLTRNRSNPGWRPVVAEVRLEGNGLAVFRQLC
ncbi:hypothetical protein BWQ96_00848 [Gracilariopsis chorda]|uniref:Uncharacterized protein n=1 Tax=Gracilariopsis chorda TaxID=448386 RepID=A0A2V3J4G8_9FLOR|nr:hypothetical protein BWQ96_00848 [Gracilariopsis chorda]|eukprot:PXF49274.1 hypothetical protein BWQ96_00848 [Gracilariopsis chorda]